LYLGIEHGSLVVLRPKRQKKVLFIWLIKELRINR